MKIKHLGTEMDATEKPQVVVGANEAAEQTSQLHLQPGNEEMCGNDRKYSSPCESCSNTEIVKAAAGRSRCCCSSCKCSSSSSSSGVDLEGGAKEVHLVSVERDCRICHLGLDAGNPEAGLPIELGCSCKDDLAAAHMQCAEAWFKIRGNKICEICGSVALNVAGANETELVTHWIEGNDAVIALPGELVLPAETRSFWRGHRFLNFLLACMVFAFVISWLFHFNVPS